MTITRRELLGTTAAVSLVSIVGLPVSGDVPTPDASPSVPDYPELIVLNGYEGSLLYVSQMLLGGYYLQGHSRNDTPPASEMYATFFTSDGLERACHREGRVIQPYVSHLLSDIQTAHEELHPLTLDRSLTVDDYFDLMDHLVARKTRTSLGAAELLASTYIGRDNTVLAQRLTVYTKNIPNYS